MTVDNLIDFTSPLSKNKEKLLNIGPEDMKTVLNYYNITTNDVNEMVKNIREWLKKQQHLPGDKLHDQQLVGHLMFRGFSIEKVKSNLDDFFRAPHKMPDILCQRDPMDPLVSEYLKKGYWICMPKKTPKNCRLTIFRMLPDIEPFNITTVIKIPFMIGEYRIWNEASLGDCWIFDVEHVTLQITTQMTPVLISKIIFLVLASYGARLKSIHLFNVPSYAIPVINLIKTIVKTKLGDRIFITTKEELSKLFPKECLPNDYGGEGGNFQELADEWCKTFQSDPWRQYFIELENVRTDESKRLTPLPENKLFGIDGSFRKISID